ncbi:MAG: PIN domain-containing protein [Candidatus Omnitrophica bacterium]|nr:PIN domain-containing protein [Candidatus Omnitrophota bacterium]
MIKSMRVVLDTSVFHNFDYSSVILKRLKEKGIIKVYITPMLLEEISRLMFHNRASEDLKKKLQFILDVSSERWFEDNFVIFQSELSLLSRRKDYQFLYAQVAKDLKDNIELVLEGGMFDDDAERKGKADLETNIRKAKNLRAIGVEMRQIIMQGVEKLRIKHKDITETWQNFKDKNIERWGVQLIRRKDCYSKAFQLSALLVWAMNKNKCPYFYNWVQGLLYTEFYNMKYPNMAIDEHAQADIQHLIFLRDVDAIVSEDKKFMRKAWEDLYASSGKKYFSISEIAELC